MGSHLLKPRKRNPFQKFPQARNIVTPMVRDVSQAMAREVYVHNCRTSNAFFAKWPDEEGFVATFAGQFTEEARKALIAALGPDSKLPEEEKEKIYKELILDKGLAQAAEKGTVGPLN